MNEFLESRKVKALLLIALASTAQYGVRSKFRFDHMQAMARPTQAFRLGLPALRQAGAKFMTVGSGRAPILKLGRRPGMLGVVPKTALSALPDLPVVAAVCILPTCLGFWKTEYGVTYGYASATALMGGLVLQAASTPLAALHAAALLTYGLRLNIFLLWRELNVEALRKVRERIEARSVAAGNRLRQWPFVLSCSLLYACLAAPVMVTTTTLASGSATKAFVAMEWAGLLLAATGDVVKSYVRAQRGAGTLVTKGPFRFLRHLKYRGEQILWTANMMAAFAAVASSGMGYGWVLCSGRYVQETALRANAGLLGASVVGWLVVTSEAWAGKTGAWGLLERVFPSLFKDAVSDTVEQSDERYIRLNRLSSAGQDAEDPKSDDTSDWFSSNRTAAWWRQRVEEAGMLAIVFGSPNLFF